MIASRLPPANSAIGGYFGLNRHERRGTQQIRAISVHRREARDWVIGKGKFGCVDQIPEVPSINTARRDREQLRWRLLATGAQYSLTNSHSNEPTTRL